MYEYIQEAAASLSLFQSFLGLAACAVAVQHLGTWTLGPMSFFKGLLNVVYLLAILAMLFFVYSAGVNSSA